MPKPGPAALRLAAGKSNLEDAVAVSSAGVTGTLNPTWVEWLQGFPLEWTVVERGSEKAQAAPEAGETAPTVSAALGTPSSGSKRRTRSKP